MKYRVWSDKLIFKWITHMAIVTTDGTVLSLCAEVDESTKEITWRVHNLSLLSPVVELWTGLLDKNGKEIYVGDIIDTGHKSLPNRSVVTWNNDTASCIAIVVGDEHSGLFNLSHTGFMCEGKVTIVGNIHENPELLK